MLFCFIYFFDLLVILFHLRFSVPKPEPKALVRKESVASVESSASREEIKAKLKEKLLEKKRASLEAAARTEIKPTETVKPIEVVVNDEVSDAKKKLQERLAARMKPAERGSVDTKKEPEKVEVQLTKTEEKVT